MPQRHDFLKCRKKFAESPTASKAEKRGFESPPFGAHRKLRRSVPSCAKSKKCSLRCVIRLGFFAPRVESRKRRIRILQNVAHVESRKRRIRILQNVVPSRQRTTRKKGEKMSISGPVHAILAALLAKPIFANLPAQLVAVRSAQLPPS